MTDYISWHTWSLYSSLFLFFNNTLS